MKDSTLEMKYRALGLKYKALEMKYMAPIEYMAPNEVHGSE